MLPDSDDVLGVFNIKDDIMQWLDDIYEELYYIRKNDEDEYISLIEDVDLAVKEYKDKKRTECINVAKHYTDINLKIAEQSGKDKYIIEHRNNCDGLIINILNGKYMKIAKT